jgi:hypothetical protein
MLTDAEKRRLSPEDLLMEERAALKTLRAREEENENYSQQAAIEEALESNPHIDLERVSVKGKRVNGRGNMLQKSQKNGSGLSYADYLIMAAAGNSLEVIYKNFQSLMFFFQDAQKAGLGPTPSQQLVQTEKYEFDMAYVSQKTKETLEAEASVLNTRVLALAAIKEAGARRVEIENIQREAARLNMVQHPDTMLFVHNHARVVTLEMINNPMAEAKLCTHVVCVFRPRPQGVDSVGIRSKVADVLDQRPGEMLVSGDHIKPEFKHS